MLCNRRGTSNFRLRVIGGCSMFNVPLWKLPFGNFFYGRYNRISARIIGSWRPFWTPDEALESEDEAFHLREAQSNLHHQLGRDCATASAGHGISPGSDAPGRQDSICRL